LCQSDNAIEGNVIDIDEFKKYLDYRFVSASEAAWRIFKFDMHEWFPTVERLAFAIRFPQSANGVISR